MKEKLYRHIGSTERMDGSTSQATCSCRSIASTPCFYEQTNATQHSISLRLADVRLCSEAAAAQHSTALPNTP
jgi:hypothetical protein